MVLLRSLNSNVNYAVDEVIGRCRILDDRIHFVQYTARNKMVNIPKCV